MTHFFEGAMTMFFVGVIAFWVALLSARRP